jgi:hypothetical protein
MTLRRSGRSRCVPPPCVIVGASPARLAVLIRVQPTATAHRGSSARGWGMASARVNSSAGLSHGRFPALLDPVNVRLLLMLMDGMTDS